MNTRTPALSIALAGLIAASASIAPAQDIQRGATIGGDARQAKQDDHLEARGWTVLFDGSSTEHWRGYRKDGFPQQGWTVEDGSLKVNAGGGGGDVITKETYENFELVLEWKASPGANSGIMYRVTEQHDTPWKTGPEYQILDDKGYNLDPTSTHSAGALYDLSAPSEGKRVKPAGEWNTTRIVIEDGVVEHWLNGEKVVEADLNGEAWKKRVANSKFNAYEGFGAHDEGHIALQDHGNDVWFRNIRVRDLDALEARAEPLFNGEDLSGWTTFFRDGATSEDTFTVEDGVLDCSGNPIGYIRTEETYRNFVLFVDWRWAPDVGEPGNSGVLVRMVGQDAVWPKCVEAQLQHGSAGDFWNIGGFDMQTDPDRTRGRNTKKTVGAENPAGEWNRYEIVVIGGDVVLFVNGREVNRAWNVEEVAGHICLQSEGAPIRFRNIRLIDLGGPSHSAVTPVERTDWAHDRFVELNERVQANPEAEIIFIGDSITQGWESAGAGVWKRFYGERVALNLGVSGDRTQHVLWRLEHGNIDGLDPKVAVVMIGTNNSNGRDNTAAEIADGVRAVVRKLRRELPGTKILLLDIFPRGAEPNPQRGKILQANQMIAKLHDGETVFHHPIGHRFLNADGTISRDIMPDSLHLSEAGYAIWAEAIERALARLLDG